MRGMAWLLPLATGAGCIDHGLSKGGGADGVLDPPDIEVLPLALEFGDLGPGETTRRRFTVINQGTVASELVLEHIELQGDGAFTFVEVAADGETLGQGESVDVEIAFTPTEPVTSDALARVHSNDEDEPVVEVTLAGSALIPMLEIDPDPMELGELPVGCERLDDLTLRNVGNAELSLSELSYDGVAFSLPEPPALPLVLPPGRSTTLPVRFAPTTSGDHTGTLTVTTNEASGLHVATQHGVAEPLTAYRDVFDIPFDPPVDILFYVDHSDSMIDDQAALAENFDRFIARLAEVTTDWAVLPITRDDGCTEVGVLTAETPSYHDQFLQAVTLGTHGTLTEAGLTIASNALSETGPDGCNAGFLREGSYVHVVLVSDEPEQSAGSWDEYVAQMRDATRGATSFKISAVAGDFPGGCETPTNSATPGTGYWEAVVATGGTFLSICSSWSSHADALALETITRETFPLSGPVDLATLQVTVNGVVRGDWIFDEPAHAVVFPMADAPTEGDEVVLEYVEPLVCP